MATVYVVLAGNKYEGLQIMRVFNEFEVADSYLKDLWATDSFYHEDKEHEQFDAVIEPHEIT